MKDNQTKTIRILTIVVVALILILAYIFLIQPGINKYAYERQIEGVNFVYNDIVTAVQSQGYYAIPLADNQTLFLVPYNPEAPAQ